MLQTLSFNGPRIINAAATFFRYESAAVDSVDQGIKLRADGADLGIYYPGDSVELPSRAKQWEISPLAATGGGVVRLGLGRVASARLVGVVAVSNKIGAGVSQAGGSGNTTTVGAYAAVQVVAPATNPRGVVVRRTVVSATSGPSSTSVGRLIAAPTMPATDLPANGFSFASVNSLNGQYKEQSIEDRNFQIPAGWGIWFVTVNTAAPAVQINYEFVYEAL